MKQQLINYGFPLLFLGAITAYFVTAPAIPGATADELAEVAVGYYKAKQVAMAKDELNAAWGKDPKNHRAHYVAGMIALGEDDFSGAVSHLSAAVDAKHDDWDAVLSLGVAYQNLRNYRAAAERYEQVAKAQPANAKVFYNMGMMDIEILQYDLAKRHLGMYLKLAPDASDKAFVLKKLSEIDSQIKGHKTRAVR